jgi:hypothetical protein
MKFSTQHYLINIWVEFEDEENLPIYLSIAATSLEWRPGGTPTKD